MYLKLFLNLSTGEISSLLDGKEQAGALVWAGIDASLLGQLWPLKAGIWATSHSSESGIKLGLSSTQMLHLYVFVFVVNIYLFSNLIFGGKRYLLL